MEKKANNSEFNLQYNQSRKSKKLTNVVELR